jgi:undecaprenyl-diphosphatase
MNLTERPSPLPFLRARFARDHYLGLPLTTGVLAVIASLSLFSLIAYAVMSAGDLIALDQRIADWFHLHASESRTLTLAVKAFTHWHGTIGILAMSALLALYMWRTRDWNWLLALWLTVPGGMLLNFGLKHVFQRLRPSFEQPILVLHSYSFPSGHSIGAALFYALLAAWLINQPALTTRLRRAISRSPASAAPMPGALIVTLAAAMTLLVGLSRMYLGAHFFSDVLAALLLGLGWFALCVTAVFTTRRHYSERVRSN